MAKSILIEKCGHLSLNLTSVEVTGECRPLRICWTPELYQDSEYYTNNYEAEEPENIFKKKLIIEKYIPYNFKDVESELSNILATELAASIDAGILGSLIDLENE
jgi:hypothetical protein